MTNITVPSSGDPITATWGASVANYLNGYTTPITAATGSISTSQTQVVGITIPANTLAAGNSYRIFAAGVCTSSASNAVTFRIRCGSTTLTGSIITTINPSATTTASGDGFQLHGLVTFRAIGASGTAIGSLAMLGGATQPFAVATRCDTATATTTVDTTASRILELTAVTAAGTTTVNFHVAWIEQLEP